MMLFEYCIQLMPKARLVTFVTNFNRVSFGFCREESGEESLTDTFCHCVTSLFLV